MKTPRSTETSTRSNRLLSVGSWTRSIGCWLTLVALLAWNPTRTLAQQPAFLTEGLVAYYPFNGNANDESGNGHQGTPSGAIPAADRNGRVGQAYRFDGVGHVTVAHHSQLNFGERTPMSVAFWMLREPGEAHVLGKRAGQNDCSFQVHSGAFHGSAWGDGLNFNLPATPDKWMHLTYTYDGSRMAVFVDGQIQASQSGRTLGPKSTAPIMIGRLNFGYPFKGTLDDVRFYNRSLSDSEVKALYAYESAPLDNSFLTNGLVAYYPFNGDLIDRSIFSNPVVTNGASVFVDFFSKESRAISFSSARNIISIRMPKSDILDMPFTISAWLLWNSDVSPTYQHAWNIVSRNSWFGAMGMAGWLSRHGVPYDDVGYAEAGLRHINGSSFSDFFKPETVYSPIARKTGSGFGTFFLPAHSWKMVTVVNSAGLGIVGRLKTYVDGVLVLDTSEFQIPTDFSNGTITIGGSVNGNENEVMNGAIGNFRVYSRALQNSEVAALYAYESAPPVPTVVMAPADQTLTAGQTLSLSAQISGSNLAYRWQKNGADLADGGRVSGATTPTLTITGVTPADAGQYRLTASNPNGSVNTAAATVTVSMGGRVVAWGKNNFGQSVFPPNETNIVAIAGGIEHTVALRADGSILAFGNNGSGQCNIPSNLGVATAISAGGYNSAALKVDGSISVWGHNAYGQLGFPQGLNTVRQLRMGGGHGVALLSNGTVRAWGSQNWGVGAVPSGVADVVQIAAGWAHNVVLKSDGSVFAWGNNERGQTTIPAGASNIKSIALGNSSFSLALKNDGTVIGWGDNEFGQVSIPAGLSDVVAIAAGNQHSVALTRDGTVVAWGRNQYGQTAVPPNLGKVIAIAAGNDHTLALIDSAPASLLVVTAPTDLTLTAGQTLSLSAQISGANLSYRWQKNGADLADGGRVSGSTTSTLTITGVTPNDAGWYRLQATNLDGSVTTTPAVVTVSSGPTSPSFLTEGLIAYYPFNGNANDESGNNNNLTGTLKIGPDRAGTGKAGVFLSPGDVLTGTLKDREAFNQNFTTAFWVKWNSGNPWYQSVFEFRSKNIPEQEAIIFQRTGLAPNNKPHFVVRYWTPAVEAIEDVWWKGDLDIANQQWVHFVILKGDLCKVFQNGKLVFTSGSYPQRSDLSSGVFTIGGSGQTPPKTGWFNPDNEVTNGSVDEFRIYNRAMSDDEALALYSYELNPETPFVFVPPNDQILIIGQTLSLSAQISGSNLAYRWQKNGVDLADGGRVTGTTTPTLTITGVTPADAGQYRLTASNANGSATTAAATVTVQAPPAITQQPQSVDGIEGESVTLQVVATGSPEPTFQWFKNGAALAGQTTASLVLSSLQDSDAGTYRVEARNAAGTVSSAEAIVTVTPAIQVLVGGTLVRDVVRTVTPVRVELRFAQSDWFLFYTLDGTDPDFLSRPYVGPINIGSAGELRTIAYSADFSASVRGRPVAFRFLQPQVIDWGVLPVVRYGDRVPLGVTASSGLPVGVSVVSGPAQIVEGQLRATGVGAVLLRAVQAGSDLFSAVTSEQSLTIDKAVQTLTWPTLSDRTFGDAPFGVGVTSSSGLPVGLLVASGKATVSGSQVTLKGAGGVVLRASQAGTDLYLPASEERGFSVAKGSQTVTFPALADRPFTLSAIALSAGSSSGLPVAYERVSGPAQLESGGLRLTGVGRVVVRATQSGNDDYLAATFVERAFEVTKGTQTITFTPIGSKTFGDAPVTLQATASSGLPVTFRVNSGPGVVEGSQLTLTGAGTVVVQAIQAGDANWSPATAVQSVPVAKAVQTLTFQPLPNRGYTTALIPLVASSSSGLPLTYRVVSGPATLVGTDLKLTGVGTVQVAADQAGDANHQPASATVSFVVSRGEQTLTFDPIGDRVLGGGPITLRATSSAGLPVAFLVVSGPATVQDNQLTLTGEGTAVVQARQVGSPLWLGAQTNQTFRILKLTTLTRTPATGGTIGVAPEKVQYQPTDEVTVTAVAAEGYQFANWTGDLSGTVNPTTLVMSANRTVGAVFKDVAAPGVSWDLPVEGSTGNELVVLSGRVTDNAAGTTATWRRDAGEALPLPLAADGSFRVDGVKLSMGDNRFTLTARDVAGNVTAVERTVTWVPERVLRVAEATEVQEGQRMVYPLQLVTDAENVAGLSFRLTYDPTYLADPQVEWSGLVGQSVNNVNVGTLGEVGGSFALAGVALPVGTNPVATVSFRARSVPFVQNVALTPRIVSLSTPAGVALTSGNAAVAGSGRILTRKIRGDNNANQRIDVGDAVVISRLEVGLEPVRSWDIALNDLNDTKSLDTGDVVRALRVVVGLDPQPKAAPRSGGELSVESGALRGEGAGGAGEAEGVEPVVGWALSRPVPQSTAAPTDAGLSEAGLNPQLSALHSQPARSLRPAGSNTNDVATLEFPDGPIAQVGKPYRVVVKMTRAGAAIAGLSFTVNYPSALTLTDKQVGALVPADALPLWAESAGSVNLAAVRSTVWPTSTGVAAVLTFLPTAGISAQATWPIELVRGEVTGAGFDIRPLDNVVGEIRSTSTPSTEPKVVVPTLPTDGGPLALDVEAAAGVAIVLETTTDLGSWSEAQRLTGQGAGKPVRVTVTPDPNARARFWRVRVP